MGAKQMLGTAVSDKPSRRMAIVIVIICVIALVVSFALYRVYSGSASSVAKSQMNEAPNNIDGTNTGHQSARMTQLMIENDDSRVKAAAASGNSEMASLASQAQDGAGSSLPAPRPIHVADGSTSAQADISQPAQQSQHESSGSAPSANNNQAPSGNSQMEQQYASAVQTQIQQIMAESGLNRTKVQDFTKSSGSASNAGSVGGGNNQIGSNGPGGAGTYATNGSGAQQVNNNNGAAGYQNGAGGQSGGSNSSNSMVIIHASKAYYADLNTMIDSDSKGPVKATLLSGPYKGSTLLGTESTAKGYNQAKFTKLITPQYGTVSVSAVLLNPTNGRPGVRTDIHHHFAQRYLLPIVGGFINSFGRAVQSSGQQTAIGFGNTVTGYQKFNTGQELAIAAAGGADAVAKDLQSQAQRNPTVLTAQGTPVAILFTADVKVRQQSVHPASSIRVSQRYQSGSDVVRQPSAYYSP